MTRKKMLEQILKQIPTGQMRKREVEKLLLRIVDSLFQVASEVNSAWSGTIMTVAGRNSMLMVDGSVVEIDNLLPVGETGKLIWIQEDVRPPKKRI